MVSVNSINPAAEKLTQLRNRIVYSVVEGSFKKYKTAAKECAKYTLENYELAKKTKSPELKVPVFSNVGLNMMNIWFLNLFRKKSPEEKALRKMQKEEKARDYADKFMKQV